MDITEFRDFKYKTYGTVVTPLDQLLLRQRFPASHANSIFNFPEFGFPKQLEIAPCYEKYAVIISDKNDGRT